MLLVNKLAYVPQLAEKANTENIWLWMIQTGVLTVEIIGLSVFGVLLMLCMMWAVPTGRERIRYLMWWASMLIGTNAVFGFLQWYYG